MNSWQSGCHVRPRGRTVTGLTRHENQSPHSSPWLFPSGKAAANHPPLPKPHPLHSPLSRQLTSCPLSLCPSISSLQPRHPVSDVVTVPPLCVSKPFQSGFSGFIFKTCSVPLMSSVLIPSVLVTPKAKPNIFDLCYARLCLARLHNTAALTTSLLSFLLLLLKNITP